MCHIPPIKYHSAFKRKEILTCVTTWMNLEDIILSETDHSQKDKHFMIPLSCAVARSQSYRDRKQNGG
jgi:hypothetical protein